MRSNILKYGFEIEGEFSEKLKMKLSSIGRLVNDGSVGECQEYHGSVGYDHSYHVKSKHSLDGKEFVSVPYRYRSKDDSKKVEELFAMLTKEHNNGCFHWNKTCGFHVHVSFSNPRPPEIMSTEFTEYFLEKVAKKFPEEFAARKNNSYCSVKKYSDDEIVRTTTRYRAINYQALSKHGTIEFRLFPSNHPEKMYQYIQFLLRCISQFTARKTLKRSIKARFTHRLIKNTALHTRSIRKLNALEIGLNAAIASSSPRCSKISETIRLKSDSSVRPDTPSSPHSRSVREIPRWSASRHDYVREFIERYPSRR